jgi:hypothetical protein
MWGGIIDGLISIGLGLLAWLLRLSQPTGEQRRSHNGKLAAVAQNLGQLGQDRRRLPRVVWRVHRFPCSAVKPGVESKTHQRAS